MEHIAFCGPCRVNRISSKRTCGGCGQSAGAHGQGRRGHGVREGQGWTPAVGGGRWWGSGRRSVDAALAMANRTRRHPIDQVQSKKYKGARRSFQFAKYLKIKNKTGKYPKWRYNQVINVWSPICMMAMFKMANLRKTLFRVLFLQFPQLEERGRRKKRSGAHVSGGNRGPPVLGALDQNLVASTKW